MESTMVDATKSNFLEKSNDFIKHLPNASFIAIDEEMTGISVPASMGGQSISKEETPAERYPKNLKPVSERYSLIQLGICLFEQKDVYESADGVDHANFRVRRYKFTLFPPADSSISREVVLNPSSLHFLIDNNMNLDKWTREGIPFCTGEMATKLLDKFYKDQQLKQQASAGDGNSNNNSTIALPSSPYISHNNHRRVELTRVEDKDFHARAMASLREWLDSALPPPPQDDDGTSEGTSFLLPPCNAFLRRALYESIPLEYPNLILETFEDSQIRVWRMNATERRRRNQRLLREGFQNLFQEKIGAYRVFLALTKACRGELFPTTQAEHMALSLNVEQAMTPFLRPSSPSSTASHQQRKIPLVVHNGLQDLLFLLTHFHAPQLPETWEACKELIHTHFPVVYDTKTMASEYCPRPQVQGRHQTHLAAVYQQAISRHPRLNGSAGGGGAATGQDQNNELAEQEHDAAFDAYMTGVAFCGLTYTIREQQAMGRHQHLVASNDDDNTPHHRRHNVLWDCHDQDESASKFYGQNKLHFHLSPYTIDLAASDGVDPMRRGMKRFSTYRISNIDPSVSTRDIVRCLKSLVDSNGRRVNYEIVWVDNVTFLVGVMLEEMSASGGGNNDDDNDNKLIHEHGEIILKALRSRFQQRGETIESLKGPDKKATEGRTAGVAVFWNLWGLFGKRKANECEEADRPVKRRRVV